MHQMNLLAVAACLTSLLVTAVDAFSPGGSTEILHRPLSSAVLDEPSQCQERTDAGRHAFGIVPRRPLRGVLSAV